MADVLAYGTLFCSDGTEIPVLRTDATEAAWETLSTSTVRNFTVTASDIGTAFPGKVIVASTPIQCTNNASGAYILRAGQIINILPVAKAGVVNDSKIMLPAGTTLQAGDQLMIYANTAAGRTAMFSCFTNQGLFHIFSAVLSGGAGTTELVSILTSNSIGDTLQGQNIVKSLMTSIDGVKLSNSGGGVYVLDDKNQIVGAQVASAPTLAQSKFQQCNIPIGLNYKAYCITSS